MRWSWTWSSISTAFFAESEPILPALPSGGQARNTTAYTSRLTQHARAAQSLPGIFERILALHLQYFTSHTENPAATITYFRNFVSVASVLCEYTVCAPPALLRFVRGNSSGLSVFCLRCVVYNFVETKILQPHTPTVAQLLERITHLEAVLRQRDTLILEQAQALQLAAKQVETLLQEIAALKKGGSGPKAAPPDWVKPNTPPQDPTAPKPKRKKRARNFTWTRREPTQTLPHACDTCPDCGRSLSGGWEYSRHQILEIPPLDVQIIDHVVLARHCGVCGKDCVAQVDSTEQTVGRSH